MACAKRSAAPGRLPVVLLAAALALSGCGDEGGARKLVVGAGPGDDSEVVAQLYAAALRAYGTPTRVETAPQPLDQLGTGEVSVVPAFTGQLLDWLQPDVDPLSDIQVYRTVVSALPEGIAAGDYTTSAQDKPALAVTEATATAWGARDVTTLVERCAQVSVGAVTGSGPPVEVGDCRLPTLRQFPDDAALFDALRAGGITAAWTTTADPDVPEDVVLLVDRRPNLIQAENVVPLYRRNELTEREVLAVNEVAGDLDTAGLADMRRQVADGADPRVVAEAWLDAHPLGR